MIAIRMYETPHNYNATEQHCCRNRGLSDDPTFANSGRMWATRLRSRYAAAAQAPDWAAAARRVRTSCATARAKSTESLSDSARVRTMPCRGSKILERDIDVVEHFDVIADEADGLDKKIFVTGGGKLLDHTFDRGTEPLSGAHSLTLEGEVPVSGDFRNAGGDQLGGFASLALVVVSGLDGSHRNAMGGEENRHRGVGFETGTRPAVAQLLGKGADEQGLGVPLGNKVQGERRRRRSRR